MIGYEMAVTLLPIAAWRGIGTDSQARLLAESLGVSNDAVACSINARREGILELLELGRGVMWSQLLQTRNDLVALRALYSELADKLDVTRYSLELLDAPSHKENEM
jgi:hypothetical protein